MTGLIFCPFDSFLHCTWIAAASRGINKPAREHKIQRLLCTGNILKCAPTKRVSKRIPRKNASDCLMGDIQEMGLQRHSGNRRMPLGEVVIYCVGRNDMEPKDSGYLARFWAGMRPGIRGGLTDPRPTGVTEGGPSRWTWDHDYWGPVRPVPVTSTG